MKILIMTFSNALSYGAILQAYSMAEVIKSQGYEATLVDVECTGNEKYSIKKRVNRMLSAQMCLPKKVLKLILFLLFELRGEQRKAKKFDQFKRQNFCLISEEEYNATQNDGQTLIICGSDQIWNPEITNGFQKEFFGINKNGLPAISYSASVGTLKVLCGREEEFLDQIRNFKGISCREKELNDFLNTHGLNSRQTIDPTLLVNRINLISIIQDDPIIKDKYLLLFYLGKKKEFITYAKRIADILQLRVISFCGSGIPISWNRWTFGDKSPWDFLNLFYHADYIVTNSFHGLSFSLIFQKQFSVILPKKRPERLENLLQQLDLENRILIQKKMDECLKQKINYENVEECLEKYRKDSLNYLLGNIRSLCKWESTRN